MKHLLSSRLALTIVSIVGLLMLIGCSGSASNETPPDAEPRDTLADQMAQAEGDENAEARAPVLATGGTAAVVGSNTQAAGDTASAAQGNDALPSRDLSKKDRYGVVPADHHETLEHTQAYVTDTVDEWTNRIDSFFVDENVDEIYRGNRLRMRLGVKAGDHGTSEFEAKFKLNVRLPRTEGKWDVFIETGSLDDETFDDSGATAEEDKGVSLGLRTFLGDSDWYNVKLDVGLRFRPQPDPFTKLRFQTEFPNKYFLTRPVQTFFWELEDGFGLKSRVDFERQFTKAQLLRSRSEIKWGEKTIADGNNVEFYSSLTYFFALKDLRGFRIEGRLDGYTKPTTYVDEYTINFRWRTAIYDQWLFFEIEPALFFREEHDYAFSPAITFRLEFNFQKKYMDPLFGTQVPEGKKVIEHEIDDRDNEDAESFFRF